jgi:hypothetical protein
VEVSAVIPKMLQTVRPVTRDETVQRHASEDTRAVELSIRAINTLIGESRDMPVKVRVDVFPNQRVREEVFRQFKAAGWRIDFVDDSDDKQPYHRFQ